MPENQKTLRVYGKTTPLDIKECAQSEKQEVKFINATNDHYFF